MIVLPSNFLPIFTSLRLCYTRQFVLQVFSQFPFVVPTQVYIPLPGVAFPEMSMTRDLFVAVTVARRTVFYFSQRLRQQKNCDICSFRGMLHLVRSMQLVLQQNCGTSCMKNCVMALLQYGTI